MEIPPLEVMVAATWDAQELLAIVRKAARSKAQGDYQDGRRPPHAFGVRAVGEFRPNRMARRFGADVFQSGWTDVEVRFSVMGGGYAGRDNGENNLGLAVRFAGGGDLVAVNTALFPVKDPGHFPDFLRRVVGPSDRWGTTEEFLLDHKDSIAAVMAFGRSRRRGRPASFAETTYHGAHAFWLAPSATCAATARETLVRYHWEPAAGDRAGRSWDDPQAELGTELADRLAAGDVRFTMMLEVAGPAQRADDPSEFWPETLERLIAGELVVRGRPGGYDGSSTGADDPAFRAENPPAGWRPDVDDAVIKARKAVYALAARDRHAVDERAPAGHALP